MSGRREVAIVRRWLHSHIPVWWLMPAVGLSLRETLPNGWGAWRGAAIIAGLALFVWGWVGDRRRPHPSRANRHQEHYRTCNCLGDSSECCVPDCECHDDAC